MKQVFFAAALAFQSNVFANFLELLEDTTPKLPELNYDTTVKTAFHHGCKYSFNPTSKSTQLLNSIHFRYLDAGMHGMTTLKAPMRVEFSIQTRKACKPRILIDNSHDTGLVSEDTGTFVRDEPNQYYDTTYVGEWFTGLEDFLAQTNLRTEQEKSRTVSLYLPIKEDGETCQYILEHISMTFYARGNVECQNLLTHDGVDYKFN